MKRDPCGPSRTPPERTSSIPAGSTRRSPPSVSGEFGYGGTRRAGSPSRIRSPSRCRRERESMTRRRRLGAQEPSQERLGGGLVGDRPTPVQIVVLLLRRAEDRQPDARGATDLTGALLHHMERRPHEILHEGVPTFGVAEPPVVAVVEKDRLLAEIPAVENAAEIGAIAHHVEREERDEQVPEAGQSFAGIEALHPHRGPDALLGPNPERDRLEVLPRQVEGVIADRVEASEPDLLHRDRRPGHVGRAESDLAFVPAPR